MSKVVTYPFMLSVTVAWFGFAALPWGISWLLTGWVPGRGPVMALFITLGVVLGCVGAGLYYVVGRMILRFLRLWDEGIGQGA